MFLSLSPQPVFSLETRIQMKIISEMVTSELENNSFDLFMFPDNK